MDKKVHQGRNVKRFREMLGWKQEALAFELGDDWNQKRISLLEQKEEIDTEILQQVSGILKIPVAAFQNFDEEQAINIISNNFDNGAILNGVNHNPTFQINASEKWMEALEEIKRLNAELIRVKDEQIELLKKIIG